MPWMTMDLSRLMRPPPPSAASAGSRRASGAESAAMASTRIMVSSPASAVVKEGTNGTRVSRARENCQASSGARDHAATDHQIALIEHHRLARREGPLGPLEPDLGRASSRPARGSMVAAARHVRVPDLGRHRQRARSGRKADEVHVLRPERLHAPAPRRRAHHHRVPRRVERRHVEAPARRQAEPAPLADREVREPVVAARAPSPARPGSGPGRNASGARRRRNPR